jgi:hypothetical protein
MVDLLHRHIFFSPFRLDSEGLQKAPELLQVGGIASKGMGRSIPFHPEMFQKSFDQLFHPSPQGTKKKSLLTDPSISSTKEMPFDPSFSPFASIHFMGDFSLIFILI